MGQFDLVIGVLLIGLFFNTYLYGLVTYQFIVYYNRKFNDRLWIKILVGTLFAIDTLHSAVAVYAAWETCVTNYNNPGSLAYASWTIPFTAVATSVVAFISQSFLGHRVFVLTQSKVIAAIIAIFSILGLVFGVYSGIYSGILYYVAKWGPLGPYVTCWLVFQTCADFLITAVLIFVLARSRTGFRRTDTIINRIIRGSVQTGLFVSVFALGDMFSFLLHRNTNLYAMFAYPMGRIYTNTLLDTLNARTSLKSAGNTKDDSGNDVNLSSTPISSQNAEVALPQTFRLQSHTIPAHAMTGQAYSINVQKEVVTDMIPEHEYAGDSKYPVAGAI